MNPNNMNLVVTLAIGAATALSAGCEYLYKNRRKIYKYLKKSFKNIFFSSKFEEKDISIIIKYLEEKYLNEIMPSLIVLIPQLIGNGNTKLLTKLTDNIKENFKENKKKYFF